MRLKIMRLKIMSFFAVILLSLAFIGCADQPASNQVLRVGLVPNQAPDSIKTQYEPFKRYLEEKLGMEVELFVANNYAGVVEAMASNRLDMAYFGGLTYVQAKQRAAVHPIVTDIDKETQTTKYYSLIITSSDSDIRDLTDLRGKTFAFGDISSTSGSLYPRIMLKEAGIEVPEDFSNVLYTGKHDATALAVQKGQVDAGGLEGRILNKLIRDGKVDGEKIRILAKSEGVEGYPWVVQDSMDEQLENKITDAFLSMEDRDLLDLMKAEGFERVTAEDYQYIEDQAKKFDLLKGEDNQQ